MLQAEQKKKGEGKESAQQTTKQKNGQIDYSEMCHISRASEATMTAATDRASGLVQCPR